MGWASSVTIRDIMAKELLATMAASLLAIMLPYGAMLGDVLVSLTYVQILLEQACG